MAAVSIKEQLVSGGVVSPAQFEQARLAGNDPGAPAESFLSRLQRVTGLDDDEFLPRLAGALGWGYEPKPRIPIHDVTKDQFESIRGALSKRVAFQHVAAPFRLEQDEVCVAVSDPFDPAMLGAVEFDAKLPVKFVLSPREEIQRGLEEIYGIGGDTLEQMAADEPVELEFTSDKEIADQDQDANVIKFVNQLIFEAHQRRATDIHFEPMENRLRVRYRVDGMLTEPTLPEQLQGARARQFQASIISRLKVMSGMNIAEKRLPQDGRINVRIKGQELDIRVSTVPTVHGESVSLRLLSRGSASFSISNLGLSPDQQGIIQNLVRKPHGIFLVTGPTGSGKSTSLYCFLSYVTHVTKGTKRILTVEEPVEYEITGANQIAVRPEIGLTFAVGLRHILRQDPNIVMVGEIRDLETAEIAIRAALTGHLVFSTLHTNDAPSAFTRLIDMGIEPFLVASSVEAVMAQRLVRTICPACMTEDRTITVDFALKHGLPAELAPTAKFHKGAGCDDCRFIGYRGRTGIYELLVVTEGIRPIIMSRAAASRIAEQAIKEGTQTLRTAGWYKTQLDCLMDPDPQNPKGPKVLRHHPTSVEEILRVTQSEEHLDSLMEGR